MDIRLNRSQFLSELTPMQGIVERRTTIPVLSHLLLSSAEDRLKIAGTDLDVDMEGAQLDNSQVRGWASLPVHLTTA